VIIPVYRARYLRDALDSVEAQTFQDFEVIVVDDGSPDRPLIESWALPERPGFRYLAQENRGPSAARNAGTRAAQGAFVAFLDADDTWEPTFLQEQMAEIARDQDVDLVHCNWSTMGKSRVRPYRPVVACTSLLREEHIIILSSVLARRETVLAAGLFDENFRHGEDFDLWLRMLKRGARLVFQPRVLLNRRVHSDSLSHDALNHDEKALMVLEKFRGRDDLSDAERDAVEWGIKRLRAEAELERAKRALATGNFSGASLALGTANEFYHSWKLPMLRFLLHLWPTLVVRAHHTRERWRAGGSPVVVDRP
jgi:glycosyltransferase involved in cell wall biosynthesis